MSSETAAQLAQFRESLYLLFPKRKDAIMNLLDALTCHGRLCDSVVQLSNTNQFERKYSSVTDAIADGLPEAEWSAIKKLVYAQHSANKQPLRFILDCTANARPHAKTLIDRHIAHAPNPAPGNKPICVGHQYSVVTLLPNDTAAEDKHWLLPLSAERVKSTDKGNEVGMHRVISHIEELELSDELCVSIGDTLYGTEKCREIASQEENLVHVFRLNSRRNLYCMPTAPQEKSSKAGRKKEFGDKINLSEPSTHPACDQEIKTNYTSRRGNEYIVTIKCWNNMLLRGSREFRASEHPLNLIQINVTTSEGKPLYARPLWLGVFGKRRDELSLVDVYQNYDARYDIEHFFRFGKRNLLLDSYQTADVQHEEFWWQFCMLAYVQLYLAKESVPCMPQPWERYLPEYKNMEDKEVLISSPSKTQRGIETLLNTLGSPAAPSIARGKAPGRQLGDVQEKRGSSPIIFKTKKAEANTEKKDNQKATENNQNDIVSGSCADSAQPDPKRIEKFVISVQASLKKFGLKVSELSEMLINSS